VDATTTAPPPLTAHLTSGSPSLSGHHVNHEAINLGRDKVHWSPEVWKRIDEAVAHETHRASVAPKILPHFRVPHHITNVDADTVLLNLLPNAPAYAPPAGAMAAGGTPPLLNVAEAAQLPLIELSVTFALSQAQLHKENERSSQPQHGQAPDSHDSHAGNPGHPHHEHHSSSTAVMLARRATNVLCLARDAVVFLGANAFPAAGGGGGMALFTSQTVVNRGVRAGPHGANHQYSRPG
jgi:hypothetical protein